MRQFEIFKPGTHTSASGATLSFSDSDIERSIRVYDPAVHEAPIVVGHPKDNGPAYGWVDKIEFADGAMVAHPKDIDPEFAEMVSAKRFKKRSASFYAPGSANHPLKGTADHDTYYLRHVGFLGAMAPAVKGLRDVEFSADDEGVVEFVESARWAWASLGQVLRSLREWMIAKDGIEAADKALPNFYLTDIDAAAREAAEKANEQMAVNPTYSEDNRMTLTPEQIAALQTQAARVTALEAENATLKTANAQLQTNFSEAQTSLADVNKKLAIATIKDELRPLVAAGRLLPAQLDVEAEFAAALDDSAQTFDFGEGAEAKKISARARYIHTIAARPVAIEFGERAAAESAGTPVNIVEAQRTLMDQVQGKK